MKKNGVVSSSGEANADELWEKAWTYVSTVVDTIRESFLILDKDLRIVSANRTFYLIFHATREETEKRLVYSLGNGQWNISKLKILLEDILPKNSFFEGFMVEHDFQKIGHKVMLLNARRIYAPSDEKPIILLAIEDVTKQKQLEAQLIVYTKKLETEVAKRTKELEKRIDELERLNKVMIGRELKMVKLKDELIKLKKSH